ncbi:MAG: BLUF domain-containing protein [Pseudomonadota bacterium]
MRLQRLVYVSKVRIPEDLFEYELSRIVETARTFNSVNSLTGLLLYSDRYFMQLLEGDRGILTDLFANIHADDRHVKCELLSVGAIHCRTFADWDMACLGLHDVPGRHLKRFCSDGHLNPFEMSPDAVIDLIYQLDQGLLMAA